MKHLIKLMFLITFSVILMQSCVDKDYDWDNIDKSGVLNIPPVMFGNIDTIYIDGLPEGILPEGIPIPDFSIAKSDTIRGIFDDSTVKDFFFDGAGTVEISAKADIELEISGLTVDLYFDVINYENQAIKDVKIAKQTLDTSKDQSLSIKLEPQYMKYMENAKDLALTIVISSKNGSVWIGGEDYLFIKSAIVKTGGYHFEL
ncbi:MAG: hypothetical protein ACK5KT_12015 [Dysgonomonas sp.]